MRILAVDDDKYIGELLSLIIEKAGHPEISVVTSGMSAMEMLSDAAVPFECFLLDINMPEMDGIELCRRIRTIENYHYTPIIMLTAMSDKSSVDSAFQAGATDYATKPFELLDLTARLRVAQKMVTLRNELVAATLSLSPASEADAQLSPGLLEEVEIKGFKNLIRMVALQNYVTQMSTSGSAASQVFAIKIDGVANIHARASSAEFQYVLTETADAITHCLQNFGHMMAYAGNGVFLIVAGKCTFEPGAWLEAEIQDILDEKDTQYDSGAPLDIEVSVGNSLRPIAGETHRAKTSFERAIARAEHQSCAKRTAATVVVAPRFLRRS